MQARIKNVPITQEFALERNLTREWLRPPPRRQRRKRAAAPPHADSADGSRPGPITASSSSSSTDNWQLVPGYWPRTYHPDLSRWPDADSDVWKKVFNRRHGHPTMSLLKGREVELTLRQRVAIRNIECDTLNYLECDFCKYTSKRYNFGEFGWLIERTWPSWREPPAWGLPQTVEDAATPRTWRYTWTWIGWPVSAITEVNYVCFECAGKRCRREGFANDRDFSYCGRPTSRWLGLCDTHWHTPEKFQTDKFTREYSIRL